MKSIAAIALLTLSFIGQATANEPNTCVFTPVSKWIANRVSVQDQSGHEFIQVNTLKSCTDFTELLKNISSEEDPICNVRWPIAIYKMRQYYAGRINLEECRKDIESFAATMPSQEVPHCSITKKTGPRPVIYFDISKRQHVGISYINKGCHSLIDLAVGFKADSICKPSRALLKSVLSQNYTADQNYQVCVDRVNEI